MIKCSCGKSFRSLKEWNIHFHLGLPSIIRCSRLLPWMTKEKEEETIKEREEYIKKHSILNT